MNLQTPISIAEEREAERKKNRRFNIIMSTVFAVVFAAIIALVWVAALVGEKDRDRFMSECTQDHKHYECVAMWRAGDRDTPLPSIIVIPTVR